MKLKIRLSSACSPGAVDGSQEVSTERGRTGLRGVAADRGFKLFPPWPPKPITREEAGQPMEVCVERVGAIRNINGGAVCALFLQVTAPSNAECGCPAGQISLQAAMQF